MTNAEQYTNLLAPASGLLLTLALSVMPLPDAIAPFRPDWVAVVLLYWSLEEPRRFSLLTAFWMGIALDTLTGSLLGQHSIALLTIVYLAERFHLRLRVFPVSQLAITVLVLLGLYEFILFWIDGAAGRTVPLIERWAPPLTGTVVWLFLSWWFSGNRHEARARI
jgi:rod shape-determining protein MreD